MAGNLTDVITYAKFQDDIFRGTILQVFEFPIFLFPSHLPSNKYNHL